MVSLYCAYCARYNWTDTNSNQHGRPVSLKHKVLKLNTFPWSSGILFLLISLLHVHDQVVQDTIGATQIQISATDLSRTQQHKVLKLNTFSWSTEVKRHLVPFPIVSQRRSPCANTIARPTNTNAQPHKYTLVCQDPSLTSVVLCWDAAPIVPAQNRTNVTFKQLLSTDQSICNPSVTGWSWKPHIDSDEKDHGKYILTKR